MLKGHLDAHWDDFLPADNPSPSGKRVPSRLKGKLLDAPRASERANSSRTWERRQLLDEDISFVRVEEDVARPKWPVYPKIEGGCPSVVSGRDQSQKEKTKSPMDKLELQRS